MQLFQAFNVLFMQFNFFSFLFIESAKVLQLLGLQLIVLLQLQKLRIFLTNQRIMII